MHASGPLSSQRKIQRTSELRGKQQSLEQGVEVAGPALVLDAAQIASSSG